MEKTKLCEFCSRRSAVAHQAFGKYLCRKCLRKLVVDQDEWELNKIIKKYNLKLSI